MSDHKWTIREVRDLIESEGFHYFFCYYANPNKLPDELKPAAAQFVETAATIEKILRGGE